MTDRPSEFTDAEGRRWRVHILWGHPAPAELGIHAARFESAGESGTEQRLGYVERAWLDGPDVEALREALVEADPVP